MSTTTSIPLKSATPSFNVECAITKQNHAFKLSGIMPSTRRDDAAGFSVITYEADVRDENHPDVPYRAMITHKLTYVPHSVLMDIKMIPMKEDSASLSTFPKNIDSNLQYGFRFTSKPLASPVSPELCSPEAIETILRTYDNMESCFNLLQCDPLPYSSTVSQVPFSLGSPNPHELST